MKCIPLVLFLVVSSTVAETTEEFVKQVRREIKAEIKVSYDGTDNAEQQHSLLLRKKFSQLSQKDVGEYGISELLSVIEEVETTTYSEKLGALCRTLVKQLQTEQENQEALLIDEMQKGIAEAVRVTLVAKTMKELDPPMIALRQLIQKTHSEHIINPKLRDLANQTQQLAGFLKQWQDYFAAVDLGNDDNVRQHVPALFDSGQDYAAFMKRSGILARVWEMQQLNAGRTTNELDEKVSKILADTHSLEDMVTTITKLENLSVTQPIGTHSEFLRQTLDHLRIFQNVYIDLSLGLGTILDLTSIFFDHSSDRDETFSSLLTQLLLFALPRALQVADSDAPKSRDEIRPYFHRVAATACERSDWALLRRTIDFSRRVGANSTPYTSDSQMLENRHRYFADLYTLQLFLAGINQERAGQYALTVNSFQSALRTGSQIVSPKLIGDRLESIHRSQPQEFEKGAQMAFPESFPSPRVLGTNANQRITAPPKRGAPPVSKPAANPVAVPEKQ